LIGNYVGQALPIITSYILYTAISTQDIAMFELDANVALVANLWNMSFWDSQLLTNVIMDANVILAQDIIVDANYAQYRLSTASASLLPPDAPIVANFAAYLSQNLPNGNFNVDANSPLAAALWSLIEWNTPVIQNISLDASEAMDTDQVLDANA